MTGAQLRPLGDGRFEIVGPVVFGTAGDLLGASQGLFSAEASVTIDLGGVTKVDSAALALLLELIRRARARHCSVCFTGMPGKLRAIARLTGVEDMLGAGNEGPAPTV